MKGGCDMAAFLNVRARYSKGTLKLKKMLQLPDGAEVNLTITPLETEAARRKAKPRLEHPITAPATQAAPLTTGLVDRLYGAAGTGSRAEYDPYLDWSRFAE
jgi:predicted DNA-binding antitoxin AbrB/MazE fold protein